jgi:hypothetical protein
MTAKSDHTGNSLPHVNTKGRSLHEDAGLCNVPPIAPSASTHCRRRRGGWPLDGPERSGPRPIRSTWSAALTHADLQPRPIRDDWPRYTAETARFIPYSRSSVSMARSRSRAGADLVQNEEAKQWSACSLCPRSQPVADCICACSLSLTHSGAHTLHAVQDTQPRRA